jgi:tetratricopeptide (TPR) repeat protein
MPSRQQIEDLLKDDPGDVFLQYALAKACAAEGDATAALAQYDRVIAAHPDYVAAYFQKGQLLADEGQTDAAREIVTRGIEVARRVGDRHAEGEMMGFVESLD